MILVVQPKFCAKKSVNLFEKKKKRKMFIVLSL